MGTDMFSEPVVVDRAEQPYVAIRRSVTMGTIPEAADRIPDVLAWLGTRGIEPAGPPFLKYDLIDMDRKLELEAGWPTASAQPDDGEVVSAVLPAGRYATVVHRGHFSQLYGITAALLDWAAQQGLEWDLADTAGGQRWGCRLEEYLTNPAEEPDPAKWETRLAFRLAD
jgi:effector-binding domain-containing protein